MGRGKYIVLITSQPRGTNVVVSLIEPGSSLLPHWQSRPLVVTHCTCLLMECSLTSADVMASSVLSPMICHWNMVLQGTHVDNAGAG